jgi:hypothetical protein
MRRPCEHTDNMNKGIKPLLAFINKWLNGKERTDRENQTLDEIFRALVIKELPHYQGCITRIHLQTHIRNKIILVLDVLPKRMTNKITLCSKRYILFVHSLQCTVAYCWCTGSELGQEQNRSGRKHLSMDEHQVA